MRITDAARRLGLRDVNRVYKLVRAGVIPATKDEKTGVWDVPESSVEDYLTKRLERAVKSSLADRQEQVKLELRKRYGISE